MATQLGNFRGEGMGLGLGWEGFKRTRRKRWCNLKARLDVRTWIAGSAPQGRHEAVLLRQEGLAQEV